jgi:hypothetical protein
MDGREQRGLVIAALCKLNRKSNDKWLVPSQTENDTTYSVNPLTQKCTCYDNTERGVKCKHLYAVEIVMRREVADDGTVTETKSITFTEKKTYKQNWPAYNAAQSVEKDRFQVLLADLCRPLPSPAWTGGRGRKPHTVADSIFAMVFKVYSTFSARRFSSDLREALNRGHLSRNVPGLKTAIMMEQPEFTPILKQLVAESALPLRAVETDFAVDSSGFGSSKFERWYDQKYGTMRRKCVWVKTHIMSGVKTNVVTAVRILDKDAADSPQFIPLVKETTRNFTINEVSADKAYASLANFRSNTTGATGGLFEKMFRYFQFKQDEYMEHYHKRSNVESTFSMIKRKFGDAVRAKSDVAMVNEVLCKLIAHNLCCLIQEEHELGIESVFWKDESKPAPVVVALPAPVAVGSNEPFDFGDDFRFSD